VVQQHCNNRIRKLKVKKKEYKVPRRLYGHVTAPYKLSYYYYYYYLLKVMNERVGIPRKRKTQL